jgi:hypothetical protein
MWRGMSRDEHKHTEIYSGSGCRSVIPDIHFLCVALERTWSTKVEEAWVCV